MNVFEGVTISESNYKLASSEYGKLAIFLYSGTDDPNKILDYAVHKYVGNLNHYELIDSNLNNPWMRVVISNINDMNQEDFNSESHKL